MDVIISIHALHEESDLARRSAHITAPQISIHALHEESDQTAAQIELTDPDDFNPRSP